MINNIGVDITSIARIEAALYRWNERFVRRIFTQEEADYCRSKKNPAIHFAGKFSAKEAFKKAAGVNLSWTDIGIINGADGKPSVKLAENRFDRNICLSISHSDEYAVAFVTVEENTR